MKPPAEELQEHLEEVAPLAGAWIETVHTPKPRDTVAVAPLAGAWIETDESGDDHDDDDVAPLAGAWIET